MTSSTPGARYVRCALQVNGPTYTQDYQGNPADPMSDEAYAEQLIEVAVEEQVEILAVTDHHSTAFVRPLQRAAEGRGITVLPGVEVTSQDGVHLLCIFDESTPVQAVDDFFIRMGCARGASDPCSRSALDLIAAASASGAIVIAPHVEANGGLLKQLRGRPRENVLDCVDLLALGVYDNPEDLKPSDSNVLRHNDARGPKPLIRCNDVKRAEQLRERSKRHLFKMDGARPSHRGLKLALKLRDDHVRPDSDEPPIPPRVHIQAIRWSGGFMGGLELRFNPEMNVLVGGRGVGKSAVMGSIGYVLGADVSAPAAQAWLNHVTGTQTVAMDVVLEGAGWQRQVLTIERAGLRPATVRRNGSSAPDLADPRKVLPVRVFQQKDLGRLAKDKAELARVVRELVLDGPVLDLADLHRQLEQSREALLRVEADIRAARAEAEKAKTYTAKLSLFDQTANEALLNERKEVDLEEREWGRLGEGIQSNHEALDDLVDLFEEELPTGSEHAALVDARRAIAEARAQVAGIVARARERWRDLEAEVTAHRQRWGARKQATDEEWTKLRNRLRSQGLQDPEQLRTLQRQRDEALASAKRLQGAEQRRTALLAERQRQLRSLRSQLERSFNDLQRAAKKLSKATRGRVRVEPVRRGDPEPLIEVLTSMRGVGRKSLGEDELVGVDPGDLAHALRSTDCEVAVQGVLPGAAPAAVRAMCGGGEALAMRVEEVVMPTTMETRFNTQDSGEHWRALDELSNGQQAAAILALLLAPERPQLPLIIDQPEDDLDNRYVAEVVVPALRKAKRSRQLIIVSHNANIPVLGDAEQLIALDADHDQSEVLAAGSIDRLDVQRQIERVLEGGRDAFEDRKRRYALGDPT